MFNISIKSSGNIVIVLILLSFPYAIRVGKATTMRTHTCIHNSTYVYFMMAFIDFITSRWTNKCWMQEDIVFSIYIDTYPRARCLWSGLYDTIPSHSISSMASHHFIAHCFCSVIISIITLTVFCVAILMNASFQMHFMFKWAAIATS